MPLPDLVNRMLAFAGHVLMLHTLLGCRKAAVMRCAVLCCAVLCCAGLKPAMLSVGAPYAAADAAQLPML